MEAATCSIAVQIKDSPQPWDKIEEGRPMAKVEPACRKRSMRRSCRGENATVGTGKGRVQSQESQGTRSASRLALNAPVKSRQPASTSLWRVHESDHFAQEVPVYLDAIRLKVQECLPACH